MGSRAKKQAAPEKARDVWLNEVADSMKSWFVDLGFPLPAFSIKTGFPSAGMRSPNITDSWIQEDDGSYAIFVRPDRADAAEVAGALAFQLCRIAAGERDVHGYLFRHLAISIGLRGAKTETTPGTLFKEMIKPTLKEVGPLSSPGIFPTNKDKKTKQTTRLLKVSCRECGYVARVSRKWLDAVGPPHCPDHGPMIAND